MKCLRIGLITAAFLGSMLCSAGSALAQADACMMANQDQVATCKGTHEAYYTGDEELDVDVDNLEGQPPHHYHAAEGACLALVLKSYHPKEGSPKYACPGCPDGATGCFITETHLPPVLVDGKYRCQSKDKVVKITFTCNDCFKSYTKSDGSEGTMPCNYGVKIVPNNPEYTKILGQEADPANPDRIQLNLSPEEAQALLRNITPPPMPAPTVSAPSSGGTVRPGIRPGVSGPQ